MPEILAVLGILVGFFVFFRMGYVRGIKQTSFPTLPPRRGVYRQVLVGSGTYNKDSKYTCHFLVTELENMGNGYSRIRVDDVTGLSTDDEKKQACNLVGSIIKSNSVEWADDMAPLLKE